MAEIAIGKARGEIDSLLRSPLSHGIAERPVAMFKLERRLRERLGGHGGPRHGKIVAGEDAPAFAKAAAMCPVAEIVEIMDGHVQWPCGARPGMRTMLMEQIKKAGES